MASDDWKQLQQSRHQNRKAIAIGAIITAVATPVLFFLPTVMSAPGWSQWIGGVLGGTVTGWLTTRRGNGAVTGVKATGYGLFLSFTIVVSMLVVYWVAVFDQFPPPIEQVFFVPLIPMLILFPVYLLSGILFGWFAAWVRSLTASTDQ